MNLTFMPLLRVQRELYAMPRGMERFREYIKTMTDAETGDLALPLVAMNPMGKDHVPALIDEYLALGAEEIAEGAVQDGCGQRSGATALAVARSRVPRRTRRLRRSQGRLDQPLGERVFTSHRRRGDHEARMAGGLVVDQRAGIGGPTCARRC